MYNVAQGEECFRLACVGREIAVRLTNKIGDAEGQTTFIVVSCFHLRCWEESFLTSKQRLSIMLLCHCTTTMNSLDEVLLGGYVRR